MWRALKTSEVNVAFICFLCALLCLLSLDLILVHGILQPVHFFKHCGNFIHNYSFLNCFLVFILALIVIFIVMWMVYSK
jgi:hypothetical protein